MTSAATAAPRTALPAEFMDGLRAVVGEDGLLADRDELLVYECDGTSGGDRQAVQSAPGAVCAARCGDEPGRGLSAGGGRGDDRADSHAADHRSQFARQV